MPFLKYKKVPLCQGSQYTFPETSEKFCYVRVLTVPFLQYKKVPFS